MIGHCWFELIGRDDAVLTTIWPWEDYGLYLVNYDVPSPKARTYKINIEGRDGQLDLTEWEGSGIVRYDDRTVTIRFRDMEGHGQRFVSAMLGRKMFIHFYDDAEYYYRGRCDSSKEETRNHVTDIEMTFFCYPYKKSIVPTLQSFTVDAAEGGSYENESVYISAGQVHPTFTASGVESDVPVVETDVVYTRTDHRAASLYTLWTRYAGGRAKGSAEYGKPRYADDPCTGVVIFDGLDLTGKTVKSIDLTISASVTGFGLWCEKTIKLCEAASGVTFSDTMKGQDLAGTSLGELKGIFYGNTTQYSIDGTLLQNIAAYFEDGGNMLVMYDPTETASDNDHSWNNCRWTDVQIDIVYEETVPSPEEDYSTLEVESDGVRQIYPITDNGPIHTDNVIFRAGENKITINNHNASNALTVTVSWFPEVI